MNWGVGDFENGSSLTELFPVEQSFWGRVHSSSSWAETSSDASLWVRMGNSSDLWIPTSHVCLPRSRSRVLYRHWRRRRQPCCWPRGRSQRLSELDHLAASPLDLFFNLKEEYAGCLCFLTKSSHWRQELPVLLSYASVFFSSLALYLGFREYLLLPILTQIISLSWNRIAP